MNIHVCTFQVHTRLLAKFEFPARTPYKNRSRARNFIVNTELISPIPAMGH